jgi:hypothetical protein
MVNFLPTPRAGVALHLDGCETCRGRFDELNQSVRLVEKHRESIRKVKGCAPGDLPRKFELRLDEAVREQEIASFHRKRTFRTSHRVGWAAALSGVCLTFAVAMAGNTIRALFHQIWDPVRALVHERKSCIQTVHLGGCDSSSASTGICSEPHHTASHVRHSWAAAALRPSKFHLGHAAPDDSRFEPKSRHGRQPRLPLHPTTHLGLSSDSISALVGAVAARDDG